MRTRISFAILICLSASQGCQWLAQIDSNRNVEQARLDDDACQDRGYRWPGDAYTECRRQLADARQREQGQELQMSRQQGAPEVGKMRSQRAARSAGMCE